MPLIQRLCLISLPLALVTGGCGVEVLDDQADAGVPVVVEQAFERSCAGAGCHAASQPAAGLALVGSALDGLVGRPSVQRPGLPLVTIGDVGGSYLAIKVLPDEALVLYGESRASGTSRMPLGGGSEVSQEDVAVILGWIAGAELPTPDPDPGGPPSAESFETDVFPLLQMRCGCHQISGGAGGLEYDAATAYDVLVGQPSSLAGVDYVVPGDPDNSYFLAKAEGRQADLGGGGDDMPPPPLSALSGEEIEVLRTWIELGADP